MHKTAFPSTLIAMAMLAGPACATPVYLALGDSITFGETDLRYVQSSGDRGYVSLFADTLAARNGGVRPTVVNLAIDGETAASFQSNAGRTPPVAGRGDAPLQLENLNYGNSTARPQSALFASSVAAQHAAGNTIQAITVTLGFNELAALAPPTNDAAAEAAAVARIPATLDAYRISYTAVLNQVRSLAPESQLYLLGYYNPFPADPASPAAPIFNAGGTALNGVIRSLATQYGAAFVDTATPFVGHEAEYTYQAAMPAGSTVDGPYGSVLPIGNVHPNARGYAVIAAGVASAPVPTPVPEPATWGMLLLGAAAGTLRLRSSGIRARRHRSSAG